MLRKLALTSTLVVTISLAFVSSAFAVLPADAVGGDSDPTASTATSAGVPWGNIAIGIAFLVLVAACLFALGEAGRNRRRVVLQ